jgi:hypothetical protein
LNLDQIGLEIRDLTIDLTWFIWKYGIYSILF